MTNNQVHPVYELAKICNQNEDINVYIGSIKKLITGNTGTICVFNTMQLVKQGY